MNRRKLLKYSILSSFTMFNLQYMLKKTIFANTNTDISAKNVANRIKLNNSSKYIDNRKPIGFGLDSINESIQAIIEQNPATITKSNLIFLQKIPNQAQDGRRVPVEISTTLPNIQKVAVLFDKNPNILIGIFDFNANMDPYLYISIKMQQSGIVYILVKSNNSWYINKKQVKVLIGGCGG
jgi:sulfur-oxidizing protein SoxY